MTQTICAVGQDGTTEPNFRLDRLLSGIKLNTALVACKSVRRPRLFCLQWWAQLNEKLTSLIVNPLTSTVNFVNVKPLISYLI